MEEKIIVAVTAHPELYDCSCPLYRDRNKKDRAWVSVSEVCGIPVDSCRRKWKSLRDTYLKEKKKMPKSGAAAGPVRKWKYLGVLSFLDPFITPRQTSGNMVEGVEEDGTPESRESVEEQGETAGLSQIEEEYQFEEVDEEAPAVSPPAPDSPPAAVPAAASTSLVRPQIGRKKSQKRAREEEESRHREIESLLLQTLRARPPPPAPQPPRSEDQLFLDSLAPSLERLEPQMKAYVKFQIHKLIYEASTVSSIWTVPSSLLANGATMSAGNDQAIEEY